MKPALLTLAVDPLVTACVVITGGDIPFRLARCLTLCCATWMWCRTTYAGSGWMLRSRPPLRSKD
jgi:hypothetical protein